MFILLDGLGSLSAAGGKPAMQAQLNETEADVEDLEGQERKEESESSSGGDSQEVSGGGQSTTVQAAKPQTGKNTGAIDAQISQKKALAQDLQGQIDAMRDGEKKGGLDKQNEDLKLQQQTERMAKPAGGA